ncbi:MAG TPA: mechanosensitive ion channel [Legionella sp.]|nr:mechanosensitive ion channel [Legionella sp.]
MNKQKHIFKQVLMMGLMLFTISNSFGKETPLPGLLQGEIAKPNEEIQKIDVKPQARDSEIKKRLEAILEATNWYTQTRINVTDGVVFLHGKTTTAEHKMWAENLARKTQDVVAVVNQMDIINPSIWDIKQEISFNLREQWHQILRILPFLIFAFFIMVIAWLFAYIIAAITKKSLRFRGIHPLLADVAARAVAFLFLIVGLYLILQLLGLTTIALTLVGGTGVIGIILGIAFKNITENLLASILLSIQKPFNTNDLIEVAGITGYVQGLTIRATQLITTNGFQAQIPNSIVYQSNILNFTKSPKRRESFIIAIDSHERISVAQEIALKTISKHPAVLKEPEPLVLVDSLSVGIINIRIYFWLDTKKYNWEKVKSSAIRLIKSAFEDAGILFPEDTMNVNFAKDTSINVQSVNTPLEHEEKSHEKRSGKVKEAIATHAEGELRNEAKEIKKQMQQKTIDKEHNLLSAKSDKKPPSSVK